jgi:FkbM family methyltransferase
MSAISDSRPPGPDGAVSRAALGLRHAIRRLRTEKTRVPAGEKVLRAAALLPLYGLFLIPLLALMLRRQTIVLTASSGFGARFTCRLPDLIQTYLWMFGEWEPDLTRFITGRLADDDVFVDVGANIGYYSLLAAACVGPNGTVVAIEASPAVAAGLRANLIANHAQKTVRVENKAASSTAGSLTTYAGPAHNVGMTTTVESHGLQAESSVEALPLTELLTTAEVAAARLIKIDVEGAEPDVVAGMRGLINTLPATAEIVLELSPKWWTDKSLQPSDVLRPFIDAGFNIYRMPNDYAAWRYLWPNDVADAVRVSRPLNRRVARLDLVLSRIDADHLPIDSRCFAERFGSRSGA